MKSLVSTAKEDTHQNEFYLFSPTYGLCHVEFTNFLKQSLYFSIKYCNVRLNETQEPCLD